MEQSSPTPRSFLPGPIALLYESWNLYRQNIKILLGLLSVPVGFSIVSQLIGYLHFHSVAGSLLSISLSIDSSIVQILFEAALIFFLFEGKSLGVRGAYKK